MASLAELEDSVILLEQLNKDLGNKIEQLRDVRDPKTRIELLKTIQAHLFETALKMPFGSLGH